MSPLERTILHCDLDAFFASVEQLDDPSLRGQPVLVGGINARGVVAAASYEARKFGCRSAMPTTHALRLCPDAIVRPGRGSRYAELSRAFMGILNDMSPLVESLSLDEAFVDVTGSRRLLGDGRKIAQIVRERTLSEIGLVVSVGVAPNKFVAKIASDLEKPDALVVFEEDGLAERLAPLPIERMWGIGPKSIQRFHSEGLRRFKDLQRVTPDWLASRFGDSSRRFHELACGVGDREVVPERVAKSIGQERTFSEDIKDRETLLSILLGEVEQVAERLRRADARAGKVTVKIRLSDFRTITRSQTLSGPTDTTAQLWDAARDIFGRWATESFEAVRLLGFSVGSLEREEQGALFQDPEVGRGTRIDAATDAIHARFGGKSISRARAVRRGSD